MGEPVASRQWSTGTLQEGLECLQRNSPAHLLASAEMDGCMDPADTLANIKVCRCTCLLGLLGLGDMLGR